MSRTTLSDKIFWHKNVFIIVTGLLVRRDTMEFKIYIWFKDGIFIYIYIRIKTIIITENLVRHLSIYIFFYLVQIQICHNRLIIFLVPWMVWNKKKILSNIKFDIYPLNNFWGNTFHTNNVVNNCVCTRKAAVIVKNYFCVFSFLTIQRPLMHVYNSHPTKKIIFLFDEVRGSCNDDVKVRGEKKKRNTCAENCTQNLGIYIEVRNIRV